MDFSYSTLCLGTRRDAATWEKGCAGLGMSKVWSIRNPKPTLTDLKNFFARPASWVYFGGHFIMGDDTGQKRKLYNDAIDVTIAFDGDRISVKAGGESAELKPNGGGFALQSKTWLVLWGGCSVCNSVSVMHHMRMLFGRHVLLGFNGTTDPSLVDNMLGGGALQESFFRRLEGLDDFVGIEAAPQAWMAAGAAAVVGTTDESKTRAVDLGGQEWALQGGKIVRGRKVA